MCEHCGPPNPETVKAHEEFEVALTKFMQATDMTDGVTVDWVLVVSQNILFEHGSSTMIGSITRLDQPTYRTTGLLTECIQNANAQNIAHHTVNHLQG